MYAFIWKFVVLVLCARVNGLTLEEARVVNITQGPVRGHIDPKGGVYAFYDIPYATAPTGPNRFKAPLDPPVWLTTFDAIDRNIACLQENYASNLQEDCLVASVFIPSTNVFNLPVIINIHGGAYHLGHGNVLKFNDLVRTQKVIVVTFNYRLGPHGFLCLGTESAPGNAGLKDQVALLRWVNTNIARFGGNPEDVTIMGCSAGGGSVDLLTLSKLSAGLFKKAVVGSGCSFGALGPQIDPIANAQKYAKLLNFNDVDNLEALEEFYKTVSFEHLISQSYEISNRYDSHLLFGPCVERDVGEEMFLEDDPVNIVIQGKYNKVPMLFGLVDMEGVLRIIEFESWAEKMNTNFADFLPGELHFENEEDKQQVAKTVKEFYFGNQNIGVETILGYMDYFTDTMFSYSMLKELTARVQALNDTIYLFEYSFVDDSSQYWPWPFPSPRGAFHCDQEMAIADKDESSASEEYSKMIDNLREYILNFILTGAPWISGSELVPWPPVNANRTPHMSLGQTIQLKDILLEQRAALWDGIYEKYFRPPIAPVGSSVSLMISNVMLLSSIISVYLSRY